jgi:hypothetical protein
VFKVPGALRNDFLTSRPQGGVLKACEAGVLKALKAPC